MQQQSEQTQTEHVQDRQHRRRALKHARISYADGAISADCIVRDQTEDGAKLKLLSPEPVPNSFSLFVPIDGLSKACTVRWRDGDHLGVEFAEDMPTHRLSRKQVVVEAETEPHLRKGSASNLNG